MKHSGLSRAIVAIAMMLIGWLPSLAHDFEVDGIYYNKLNSNEVEVTYKGNSYNYNDKYVGDVVIPSSVDYNGITFSVTRIGTYAFHSCKNLTSIEIPNSVTSIGNYTFNNCTSLTGIEIPISVTSIYNNTFNGCNGLTSIVVDTGNTEYDSRNGCNAIILTASNTLITGCKNTIIPNSVTRIGNSAFENCTSLTSIEIPNSVTSIGNSAFYCCPRLKSIIIGSGVTSIGNSAFENCTSLTSIEIPNSVTSIGESAFYRCDILSKITCLATNPPTISADTFSNYDKELRVPAGCKSAYEAAEYWNQFTNIIEVEPLSHEVGTKFNVGGLNYIITVSEQEVAVAQYDSNNKYSGDIVIPSSVDYGDITYTVTSIGAGAFSYCTELTNIEIPQSVTSIENGAFIDCTELTNIKIPQSVTSIESNAFWGCSGLTSVIVPHFVLSIGDNAFAYCKGLTKVSIGFSVKSIGAQIFQNCSNLTSVYWHATDCSDFTNYYYAPFDDSVTYFYFGDTVEHIPAYLCNGLSNLTSIEISNSVTSIGARAFSSCSSLTSIEIPNSVTSIGNYAFYSCSSLTNIEIPNSVTSIGNFAFYYCTSLKSIQIPNSVTSIGEYAFADCSSLTSVVIPNSVTSIGYNAFEYCYDLTSIVIGNSVTSIGQNAFNCCNKLSKITCLATTPPTISADTFSNYNINLYVPAGCTSAYEEAEYWNQFTNIIEIEEPRLFIDDFAINAGETKELAINLTNEFAFTGFQADLYLPDGLEIEQEDGDYIFDLTDRKGSDHVITSGKQANGAVRILCFSANLNEFSGSEGAVVKFRVTATNDFVGNYEINIKDIILAQTDESEYQLPATTTKVEARMLAKSITLDQTEVSLEATQTTTLLATILPDNTSVKTVVWTSSDEDVAVVDENGVVTAIAIGEATITATTTDGTNLSASCKVTVVPTLGDANNDAVINVTDIMVVASYILGNTPEGFVFETADVTKDGKINIIDIVAIANIILSSETPDETHVAARVARQAALGSRLFIDDTSIHEGETMQLAVNLTNDIAFSGFQADVKLPEGLELCQEDGEYMISLSDRKGNDHVLTSAMLPDGTIRILSYSMNLNDFAGADGALVYLTVKATQHFVGDYEISIDNITFTQADLTEYSLEPTVCRIAGTTSIEGVDNNVIVASIGDYIVVKNATVGSVVNVYASNGALVASEVAIDGSVVVEAPVKGVYVVKVGKQTVKVII